MSTVLCVTSRALHHAPSRAEAFGWAVAGLVLGAIVLVGLIA